MAKFLISTMPAVGHVNPFLSTARKLIECGHEVWWHTGGEVASKVESTGAKFVPMQSTRDIQQATVEAQRKDGLAAANAAITSLYVAPILGQLQDYQTILSDFSADAIVVDKCSLGAALLHEMGGPIWATLGISPLRTAESPIYGTGHFPAKSPLGCLRNRLINSFLEKVLLKQVTLSFNNHMQQVGLPPIPGNRTVFDYLMSPFLHLQGTTKAFEFPHRNLPPQIHFVGPMLPPMPTEFMEPSWWAELQNSIPIVHVTQGTVATDSNELIGPTIQALKDEAVLVVATSQETDKFGRLPSNVRLERMIPHSLLLPHVDVMVTNGGYNGVKTALAYGVPLVASGATEDKPEVCSRIAWSGAGINLRASSPTPSQIKQAVWEVLHNPSYGQKAKAIQSDFAKHDSAFEATQLLDKLIKTRKPVTVV